jgi:hypothetical protein
LCTGGGLLGGGGALHWQAADSKKKREAARPARPLDFRGCCGRKGRAAPGQRAGCAVPALRRRERVAVGARSDCVPKRSSGGSRGRSAAARSNARRRHQEGAPGFRRGERWEVSDLPGGSLIPRLGLVGRLPCSPVFRPDLCCRGGCAAQSCGATGACPRPVLWSRPCELCARASARCDPRDRRGQEPGCAERRRRLPGEGCTANLVGRRRVAAVPK